MDKRLEIVEKEFDDELIYVQLNGEIDITTAPRLKEKLYGIVGENNKDIKFDCSNLNYIDSTGLGVLVGTLKKVKSNQKNIYMTNLKNNIKRLFLITGLNKVFIIEE